MRGIPNHPIVYSRSFGMIGKAVEVRDDGAILVSFDNDTQIWLPQEDLEQVSHWKGMLNVAKQVRLVAGEGDQKIEVGTAEVQTLSSGDSMVHLTISNPALIKVLGGSEVKGIIPNFVEQPANTEDSNE